MMGDEADDIMGNCFDIEAIRAEASSRTQKHRCAVCGGTATVKDSKVIYGKSYGMALICDQYPKCDSYVGCHKGTYVPKGTTANRELRQARKQAHMYFDATWIDPLSNMARTPTARQEAYEKLAKALNIPEHECHIGAFTLDLCRDVIRMYGPEQLF